MPGHSTETGLLKIQYHSISTRNFKISKMQQLGLFSVSLQLIMSHHYYINFLGCLSSAEWSTRSPLCCFFVWFMPTQLSELNTSVHIPSKCLCKRTRQQMSTDKGVRQQMSARQSSSLPLSISNEWEWSLLQTDTIIDLIIK